MYRAGWWTFAGSLALWACSSSSGNAAGGDASGGDAFSGSMPEAGPRDGGRVPSDSGKNADARGSQKDGASSARMDAGGTPERDASSGSHDNDGGRDADAAGKPTPDGGGSHDHDSGPDARAHDGGAPETDSGSSLTLLTCSDVAATTSVDAGAAPGVVAGMVRGPGTFVGGCQIFPADNAWNVDVSATSIPTTSVYTGIPQGTTLHPDLGGWTSSGPYGIPYNVVPSGQPSVTIDFTAYAGESDPGPNGWTSAPGGGATGVTAYPIPNGAEIEGDPGGGQIAGDDHLLVIQQGSACGAPCTLWETWQTTGGSGPPWTAANGARWDLASNALRPLGWTSADAAGLSVFAGLLRIAEVKAGVVTHAIRVTFQHTQKGYLYPATHFAGSSPLGGSDPPMGLRLRLKTSTNTSGFSAPGKVVAKAMQTYGLIVADIGSDWYFQGDSDNGWDDTDPASPNGNSYVGDLIQDFRGVSGADFEALDTGTPQNTGE